MSADEVVLPPSKEEVLALWRANRRARRAAALEPALATVPTEIPAARASSEALADDVLPQPRGGLTWSLMPDTVSPQLLCALSAGLFVSAFALGESTMLSLYGF